MLRKKSSQKILICQSFKDFLNLKNEQSLRIYTFTIHYKKCVQVKEYKNLKLLSTCSIQIITDYI